MFLSNNFKKGQKLDIRAKQKSPVIFKITGLYVGEAVQKGSKYGKIGGTEHEAVRMNGVYRKGKQRAGDTVAGQN